MTVRLEGERAPRSTRRAIRGDRKVAKLLVVDPDPTRATAVARALGLQHMILTARETTLALAVCVRDRPDLVIASVDLGSMRVDQFAAMVDYARHGHAPPIIVVGELETGVEPPIVAVVGLSDLDGLARKVEAFVTLGGFAQL